MSFPKPPSLVAYLAKMVTNSSDLILDFFAGSATTAQAVMELNQEDGGNRKYICVQLAEPCDEKSEAYQAGYKTIAEIAKERIRRAARKIESEHPDYQGDLGFKVFRLSPSNFRQWRQPSAKDVQALERQVSLFTDPLAQAATPENMLYEMLLKSGYPLTSPIVRTSYGYSLGNHQLILLLEAVSAEIIEALLREQPRPAEVLVLDKLFHSNDPLKTNTSLQLKEAGITFRSL